MSNTTKFNKAAMYNDEVEVFFEKGKQGEFLNFMKALEKETKWEDLELMKLKSEYVAIGPMFAQDYLDKNDIRGNDLDALMSTITLGEHLGYTHGSQFLVDNQGKKILLSSSGYNALSQVTGASCPAFARRAKKKQEEFLNYDLTTSDKTVQAQIVADKIQTFHSSRYAVLKKDILLNEVLKSFDDCMPIYEFEGAEFSHGKTTVAWSFEEHADEIIELYDDGLFDYSGAIPVVKFVTSDIGDSAASVSAYIMLENSKCMKIGSSIKVYHRGSVTEADIKVATDSLFAKFADMVACLAEAQKMKINNPKNTILNVGIGLCQLPKQPVIDAAEEFVALHGEELSKTKASDIFFVLQNAIQKMTAADKYSAQKVADAEELVLRILVPGFKWGVYDSSILTSN